VAGTAEAASSPHIVTNRGVAARSSATSPADSQVASSIPGSRPVSPTAGNQRSA
jgi:hypothetical protein